jgi:spermidine/putrescine transport system permease protein
MSQRGETVRESRALIAPAWVYYLTLLVAPLCIVAAYAFGHRVGYFTIQFGLSGENFRRLWDPIYVKVFLTTFRLAAIGTLGCLLVGYPFAYWLATRPHKHRTLLLLLVVVPFWTSILIRTFAWALLLSRNGPLSSLLQRVGLIGAPLNVLNTNRAVWIGLVYDYLPLMLFPLYVSIERVDRHLVEAAKDLGLGRIRTFVHVTFPLTLAGVATGSLLVFIPMTGEYVVPSLLGGGKSALFGPIVASQFLNAIDYPFGSAMSLVLVGVLLVVVFAYLRTVGRRAEENLGTAL